MSDTLRIALVSEGVTDYEFLHAAVDSMLAGRSFILKLLQPDDSIAFTGSGDAGELGGGWRGVYQWCLQATERNDGGIHSDPIFDAYDLLIVHLDADVAAEDPANHKTHPIPALKGILPCVKKCPPASDTTVSLRNIMLVWLGESHPPPRTVFCTPSKSLEAWLLAIFFPSDRQMIRSGWECYPTPELRLSQQSKTVRFKKTQAEYRSRHNEIRKGWPKLASRLSEAKRFQDEFQRAIEPSP